VSVGHATTPVDPATIRAHPATVVAAGVGTQGGLRSVSFHLGPFVPGRTAVGIAGARGAGKTALIDLLAGLSGPAHGKLWVLGDDLSCPAGRAAVRRRIGLLPQPAGRPPGFTVRQLVAHAAWLAGLPGREQDLAVARALDSLRLADWANLAVRSIPEVGARLTWLAAASVHEPELLLLDGVLDGMNDGEAACVADAVREVTMTTPVVVAGRDPERLDRACGHVLTLAQGVIAGG
jgi:ABC-type multidrug transport system ATPase subunit